MLNEYSFRDTTPWCSANVAILMALQVLECTCNNNNNGSLEGGGDGKTLMGNVLASDARVKQERDWTHPLPGSSNNANQKNDMTRMTSMASHGAKRWPSASQARQARSRSRSRCRRPATSNQQCSLSLRMTSALQVCWRLVCIWFQLTSAALSRPQPSIAGFLASLTS